MLGIDCLLRKTHIHDMLKQAVRYIGEERAASGKDASLESVYNDIRKAGIEVDITSVGDIYANELPIDDARFSSMEDIEARTGRAFDSTVRNMILQKPKEGVEEIGELSPSQYVAKKIADTFASKFIVDNTTKSIMKTLQDAMMKGSERLLGELPESKQGDKKPTVEEIIQRAIDVESKGFTDKDGALNGIKKVFDATREEIKRYSESIEGGADEHTKQLWNEHVKSMESAVYSLLFSRAEGKEIVKEALLGKFGKDAKSGRILDWSALAGNVNDVSVLHDNVVAAFEGKFGRETAERIADSMQKEFREIRGEIVKRAWERKEKREESYSKKNQKQPSVKDVVAERLKESQNVSELSGDDFMVDFSKKEGREIVDKVLTEAGITSENKAGEQVVDLKKLANVIDSKNQLRKLIQESIKDKGYSDAEAAKITDGLYKVVSDVVSDMKDRLLKNRERIEDTWTTSNNPKAEKDLLSMVEGRMKDFKNFIKFNPGSPKEIIFRKSEAKEILSQAIKTSDLSKRNTKGDASPDWAKIASGRVDEKRLSAEVVRHLVDMGISESDARQIAKSMPEMYREFLADAKQKAEDILDSKERMLDKDTPTSKSELTRLAELYDLGVFNAGHDKLLASVLGIEAKDRQAMDDVKQYAEKLSQLRELMQGNDFIVPTLQRAINSEIHDIVARNIEDKTKLLKIVSGINKMYQLENTSLISGYRNLLENHLSGLIEYMTTKANMRLKVGAKLAGNQPELRKNMIDTWKNIAEGGAEFGETPYQVGGNQLRLADQYNIKKMRGADWSKPKTYLKAAATASMAASRAFLAGTDGAIKTGLYRLHFISGIHDALIANGKSQEESVAIINEAIYGEGALDRAKEKAKELYEKMGMDYVSQKQINITANELLHENLIQGSEITPDQLREIQTSAFRQAGLGLGHESNNVASKAIQSSKLYFQRKEQQAFNKGEYGEAAKSRALNTVVNSVLLRFAASQFNWGWIKVQQSGIGIITGLVHIQMGRSLEARKVLDAEQQKRMADHYMNGRQQMYRGAVGLTLNAMTTLVVLPAIAKMMNPDEADPVQKMFDDMEDNYVAKALFLKLTPIWGLGDYFYHKINSDMEGKGSTFRKIRGATGEVIGNITGNNSMSAKFSDALKLTESKNERTQMKGDTKLGSLVGSFFPHVPFYKQGKDVLQTVDYLATGRDPMYKYPYGFMSGLLGGGVIEDLGLMPDKPIQALPFTGKKEQSMFEESGIMTIKDIEKQYGEGADEFIMGMFTDSKKGAKAVKAYHAEIGK